jgi:hypothetical protein
MPAIDRTSELTALIRLQLSARNDAARKSPPNAKQTSNTERQNAEPVPRREKSATTSLDSWVAQRVAALTPDDPNRRRKVFRIFLESVLTMEFGTELIGDSGFDQLVEQVLVQMESDPELSALIDAATQALIEAPPD